MTDSTTVRPNRPIKSFVTRAGRMGPGQVRALAELGPRFLVAYKAEPLNTAVLFGRDAPVVLEIGFGMGTATIAIAQALPETDFIGIEVHTPGVGALLKQIGETGATNVRVIEHDAVEVLDHMIAPDSLAGVHVFFPDPWHKLRHNKRRLIQPPFVARLVSCIAPGGYLHCATDWQPYAEQMLAVLTAEPRLVNTTDGYADAGRRAAAPERPATPSGGGLGTPGPGAPSSQRAAAPERPATPSGGGPVPRAEGPVPRPLTKFENRGLKLGHGVWDLVFRRR